MRIMLIQPASNIMKNRREGKPFLPPLNLMYLAGALRLNGFTDIKILDVLAEGFYNESVFKEDYIRYGLSPETIKDRIKEFNPDVVGVSCMVDLRKYHALEICELAKEVNKDIITIVGGNPVSINPKWFLKEKYIDYAIIGEGEEPLVKTIKGEKPDTIDGIAFKSGLEYIIRPQKYWRKDLDNMAFPAHDLINLDMYYKLWVDTGYQTYKAKKFSMSMMARGCPNKCEHCPHDLIFPGYRTRSAQNIFDEMKWANSIGIEEMQFHEYNGIVSWPIVDKFCNLMIESGLAKTMRWGWPIGIWLKALNKDRLKKMREAGMDYVCLAIESYDQCKLDSIMKGKDVDLEHTLNVIQWCRELDYNIHAFFMIGLEGQNKKDIESTIDFAKKLYIDTASFFIAQPLPGTPFWDHCIEKKLFVEGFDTFHIRYGKANIYIDGVTPLELEEYRHNAREDFIKSRGNEYQKIKESVFDG